MVNFSCSLLHAPSNASAAIAGDNPFSSGTPFWNGIEHMFDAMWSGIGHPFMSTIWASWFYIIPEFIWMSVTVVLGVIFERFVLGKDLPEPLHTAVTDGSEEESRSRLQEEGRSADHGEEHLQPESRDNLIPSVKGLSAVFIWLHWALLLSANLGWLGSFVKHMSFSSQGGVMVVALGCLLVVAKLVAEIIKETKGCIGGTEQVPVGDVASKTESLSEAVSGPQDG
ncbi:hypothetical protein B0A55_04088 [Friedmanniomyces simplex]|uniref:Uncharacterized protein n=1 Tax=Friedmanniomyces simplex TaxID=329884 RepID=A0A4U0XX40_9PEZI|nr:hypothetical protein B0A55_04088 [Friedmanniomyces simplex]